MPIYEYSCDKCGNTIEVIQKFSDAPLVEHQGCGGSLTKLISASGFQFKGTGWYVTDYARKGAGEGKDTTKETKTDSNGGKHAGEGKSKTPAESKKKDGSTESGGS